MQVSHNHVITLHYQLKDDNGKISIKVTLGIPAGMTTAVNP